MGSYETAQVHWGYCRAPIKEGPAGHAGACFAVSSDRRTDPSLHSQAKLNAIARQLNERFQKTLLYQIPTEKFVECVAAIG
jgi:hypothetical protein